MRKPGLCSLLAVMLFTSCSRENISAAGTSSPTLPLPQTTEGHRILPTPVIPGKMIIYDQLQVVMSQAEITAGYLTEFGSRREPPAGKQFFWIRVKLKNTDQRERPLPETEHFSTLYGRIEFKPTYGHRNEYRDYTSLSRTIYQGQEVDAWLRFDIPASAKLADLWFVFLPESSRVSVSFSPAEYPWGDHPIYLWACTP